MRIAYLIDTIATGTAGTQKQLLETIRRLDRGEFQPELICLWESPWMRENPLPCPLTVLGYRGFLKPNFPSVLRTLAAVIDRHEIDLIQTFFEDSIFVTALAMPFARRSPILLSSRRDIGLGAGNQPWYHKLFAAALPRVNRRFRGIIANSEQVRRYVASRERTPLDKIKVVYNGVALPSPDSGPVPAVFTEHPSACWIGLVASLTPVKRHDLLIQALAAITRTPTTPEPHVLLLGEGPEHARLEQLAEVNGVRHLVHFAGAVQNVSAYLPHMQVGVLCSDREGLSNAILEYMTFGLPVVATEVGGNSELVSAQNGICVPPGDAESLAQALSKLISDPALRARLGEASLRRVRQEFSWERSLSELGAYYRSLVKTPRYTSA